SPGPPLPCPISVFGGEWDPTVHTGQLDGWKRHTTADCGVRVFPGGHFFLADNRSLVARALRKDLSR
ncbi:thioesterase II family protein, partial [Kibdelosporangium lantanae]